MSNDTTIQKNLLANKEAATYLGCAANSLKLSRSTGVLFKKPAPTYLKMGSSVRYKIVTLDKWLDQFAEQSNTAQN